MNSHIKTFKCYPDSEICLKWDLLDTVLCSSDLIFLFLSIFFFFFRLLRLLVSVGVETVCFVITLSFLKTGNLLCRSLSFRRRKNQEWECRGGIKELWEFYELGKLWQKNNHRQKHRVILFILVLWFLKCSFLILRTA